MLAPSPDASDTLPAGALRFADPVGSVIAERYRILDHLSDGGMATVYLAEHVAVGRKLAIKILHPEQSCQPDVVRRFLQEARAASQVTNPHVVEIIDVGFTSDGLAYMAMELLDGEDLGALLAREGPLPWSRLGPIVLQICDALAATHAQGIVHRDIKPENCVVTEFNGARDFIKIIDFGVAKDLSGLLEGDRPRTISGSVYGTAAYVAPETLGGKVADHRVDIYALGILMYELLLGQRPFAGEAISDILLGHLQRTPAPLRSKIPERVSEAVDAVILRALEKDPGDRWQSMPELAEAVAEALDPAVVQRGVEDGTIPTGAYLAVVRRDPSRAHRAAAPAPKPSRWIPWIPWIRWNRWNRWNRWIMPALLAALTGLALTALLWRWWSTPVPAVAPPDLPDPRALVASPRTIGAPQHVDPPAPPIRGPAPVAVAVAVPPRPLRLQEAAVRKEIARRITPRARDCLATHTRLIKGQQFPVRVEILPSGEARATATLATSPAGRCIADLFRRQRFPVNQGGLTLDHAFTP